MRVRNALQPGMVMQCEHVRSQKGYLRRAGFQLQRIEKILSQGAFFPEYILTFLQTEADYWWTSYGLIFKLMLPSYLVNYIKKHQELPVNNSKENNLPHCKSRNSNHATEQTLKLSPYALSSKQYSSHLTPKQQWHIWEQARRGIADYVNSTKSGVYIPFANLQNIIVYNAESTSYKSWDQQPYYDARRSAIHLSRATEAKLKFKSPAPPVWLKKPASSTKYQISNIRSQPKADTQIIDLKKHTPKGKEPPLLTDPAQIPIHKYDKILIYHNRRGSARITYCSDCGHRFACPNCDIPLVLHSKKAPHLLCHHCHYAKQAPTSCPQCRSYNLDNFGSGADQIESSIQHNLSGKTIFRLDQDNTPKLKHQKDTLQQFHASKRAILVSTAQIFKFLDKSFDATIIPLADLEMHFPDYQAREHAFQAFFTLKLATQNDFIIQTLRPSDPIFANLSQNRYNKFVRQEDSLRKQFYYPPYAHLIKLQYTHSSRAKARQEATALHEKLQTQARLLSSRYAIQNTDYAILGPAPAFVENKKGKSTWHIFLKLPPKSQDLKRSLLHIVPAGWRADIEPIDTL